MRMLLLLLLLLLLADDDVDEINGRQLPVRKGLGTVGRHCRGASAVQAASPVHCSVECLNLGLDL